ncbi:hypothetical protein BOX15_Mlig027697g1 [Macrostomum lignano]|uniref:Uncharacterized protein n=1 Tax=Macrostomum lignano TaxID=282301 RepID=A0A267FI52_9PLAT|nr:hypothetical protein BOX15_Mlig027697g1 [Macrostomum lignano]
MYSRLRVCAACARRFCFSAPVRARISATAIGAQDASSSTPPTPESERLLAELQAETATLAADMRTHLTPDSAPDKLSRMMRHHLDAPGKLVRPLLVLLVSHVCNAGPPACQRQRTVAIVTEMIHSASLIHDDLIDGSDLRRGAASVQSRFGHRDAVLAGDHMIGVASQLLAGTGHPLVVRGMATAISDLVRGELDQLGETGDLGRYLARTYRKTAALLAHSAKCAAVLAPGSSPATAAAAFELGRSIGMAFQLVDDLLDFEASDVQLGKPAGAADLRRGVLTGPVLFAMQTCPQLRAAVARRLSRPGDLQLALDSVARADGVGQTRMLAQLHCREAHWQLSQLPAVPASEALHSLIDRLLNRQH